MTDHTKVFLMFDERLPEAVRAELGGLLQSTGWIAASEDDRIFVCRARADELEKVERRVRKSIEFAAFTAGQNGRFPFVIQVGEGEPHASSVRVGSAATTRVQRSSGADFATERIPGNHPLLPRELQSPSVTQLKTAF